MIMKHLLIIFLILKSSYALGITAVTYTFSGGRFGDNLLAYCHAKWISYKYHIPLLYKPFGYSDQLTMHQMELPYCNELEFQFADVITYGLETAIDAESNCLYVVPFFPESIFNRNDYDFPFLFFVDWEDPVFKAILNQMISPMVPVQCPALSKERVNVAIHVRKGTGWDIPNYCITPEQLTASHPLRFAPDSFFIEQLKKITRLFPEEKIYVFLFTDHNDPGQLAQKFAKDVNCERMTIDYRASENNEFINVLDDFFALTHFDCLIRADSNFSFMASKLGNYTVQISPWHGMVINGDTSIDWIQLIVRRQSFIVNEGE